MSFDIVKLDQARQLLADCNNIQEAKYLHDIAEAARHYAKVQHLSLESANYATEIKVRAQRKMGEMLKETPKNSGGRPQKTGTVPYTGLGDTPTLSDIGITKIQSSRFQSIASIPEFEFERVIAETKGTQDELTTSQLLRLSKDLKRLDKQEQAKNHFTNQVDNGSITLHHADSLSLVPTLSDSSIALVVTDPPYNTTNNDWDMIGNDEDFIIFTQEWLNAIRPKLTPNYHLFFFCDPDYIAPIEMLLRRDKWPIKSRIIWEYRNLVKGRDVTDKFIENWQMCFHIGTHALNWSLDWDDRRFMVQQHATPQSNFNEGKFHPTQKPLSLIKLLVELGSKPGDMVLDLFAGSGTTGLACQEIKRDCILIEQSADYCKVIQERLGL